MDPNILPETYPGLSDVLASLTPAGPSTQDTATVNISSVFRKKIKIFYMPASATDGQKRAVMTAMTLCTRCTDPEPARWQSYVVTLSVLYFPDLLPIIRDDGNIVDYVFEPFPNDFIAECLDAIRAQGTADTAGDKFITFPRELPNAVMVPLNADLVAACSPEGLMAFYAMVIFVFGKSADASNVAAITGKRPDAIVKRNYLQKSLYLLRGEGKINVDTYNLIRVGFVKSTGPRIHIIKYLARVVSSPQRSENLNPLVINMGMLANANQTFMFFIHELLTACPWALEIPAVRLNYANYSKMVRVLSAQPGWFRPYFKLAMQDSTREVQRRGLEILIGVATAFAIQLRPNMSQYRINENSIPAVREFIRISNDKYGANFRQIENQSLTTTEVV